MKRFADPLATPLLGLLLAYALASFGPQGGRHLGDLYVYGGYRDFVEQGLTPYLEFSFEYPPLALVPVLAAGSSDTTLALLMAVSVVAAGWAAGRLAGPTAVWAMAVGCLAVGPILSTRFDLLPAALVAAALLALTRRRDHLAFALLGAGVAVKLWPVIIAPVALAWLWRAGARRSLVTAPLVATAVVVACALPFAGQGLVDSLTYHLDRPAQIESTPASVLWATGGATITGTPTQSDEFKSNGLRGGASDALLLLFTVLLGAGVLAAAALAGRGPPDARQLVGAALMATLAFVALGKVLSPQYFAWLLPLAAMAYALGLRAPVLLLVPAAVLTQIEFPRLYEELVGGDGGVFALIAVRNVLLLAALLTLGAALGRSPTPAGARPRTSPARPSPMGPPRRSRSAPSSAW